MTHVIVLKRNKANSGGRLPYPGPSSTSDNSKCEILQFWQTWAKGPLDKWTSDNLKQSLLLDSFLAYLLSAFLCSMGNKLYSVSIAFIADYNQVINCNQVRALAPIFNTFLIITVMCRIWEYLTYLVNTMIFFLGGMSIGKVAYKDIVKLGKITHTLGNMVIKL